MSNVFYNDEFSLSFPGSSQCRSQEPQFNSNFKDGDEAGRFKYLASVNDFDNCTKLACEYEQHGDFAYLVDSQCFIVTCHIEELCKTIKQPYTVPIALARLVWSVAPGNLG